MTRGQWHRSSPATGSSKHPTESKQIEKKLPGIRTARVGRSWRIEALSPEGALRCSGDAQWAFEFSVFGLRWFENTKRVIHIPTVGVRCAAAHPLFAGVLQSTFISVGTLWARDRRKNTPLSRHTGITGAWIEVIAEDIFPFTSGF